MMPRDYSTSHSIYTHPSGVNSFVVNILSVLIHYRQKYGIFGKHYANIRIWLFAGSGLAPTTNKYCDFTTTITWNVMDEKCNLQCRKIKIHNTIYRNVSFFNILPKISNSFQGIHHYNVSPWNLFGYSLIHYWHHAEFSTNRQITVWGLLQNGWKVWLKDEISCCLASQPKSASLV